MFEYAHDVMDTMTYSNILEYYSGWDPMIRVICRIDFSTLKKDVD